MNNAALHIDGSVGHALSRAACFVVLWIILAGINVADLPVAALAVASATWTSLLLLPPRASRLSPVDLLYFALRFLRQSVVAGIDVARCALDPKLPLRPGFVTYVPRFPEGNERNLFCTIASLIPGTLPTGTDERGALIVHCLDVEQPVAAQLAVEEALLTRVLGGERNDG